MGTRDRWRKLMDNPIVEWAMFATGVLLLIVSPLVGVIPGPGGVIFAGVGLALILKTSMWAKRHYARIKKRRVKVHRWDFIIGDWTDWALRRPSARRRKALAKSREGSAGN